MLCFVVTPFLGFSLLPYYKTNLRPDSHVYGCSWDPQSIVPIVKILSMSFESLISTGCYIVTSTKCDKCFQFSHSLFLESSVGQNSKIQKKHILYDTIFPGLGSLGTYFEIDYWQGAFPPKLTPKIMTKILPQNKNQKIN